MLADLIRVPDKRQHVYLWYPTSNKNTKEIYKADFSKI